MTWDERKKWARAADRLDKLDGQIKCGLTSFPSRFSLQESVFDEDTVGAIDRARADLRCAQNALRCARKMLLHDLQEKGTNDGK